MGAVSGGILIEVSPGETRAAFVDGDGRLVELQIERIDRPPLEGGIHLGRVTRVEPSLNGAFVALAEGQDGFLRRAKGLHEGQAVVVQVTREPSGGKGPTVTGRPTLLGRYVALTPGGSGASTSKRLGSGRRRAQLAPTGPLPGKRALRVVHARDGRVQRRHDRRQQSCRALRVPCGAGVGRSHWVGHSGLRQAVQACLKRDIAALTFGTLIVEILPAAETFLKPKLLVNSSYLPPEIKFLNFFPFLTSIEKIIEL